MSVSDQINSYMLDMDTDDAFAYVLRHTHEAHEAWQNSDYLRAVIKLRVGQEQASRMMGDLVEAAMNEGYKQKELAAALGVSPSTFSRWIRGAR